ncbi:Mannose-specific lectin [Dendrobium catenatum]|uniref:Mannose-specific lectin n=1 Tax=Dendrobium catenatum TaxID=906689 RepID=A0A2I0VX94_9ASPA|nr:Mannose-specific lectin [Dendrobium catenatum]
MAFLIRTLLLCAASLTFLAAPSSGQLFNHLLDGERLGTGQALTQGGFAFVIQSDCNLVLYEFGNPLWSSGTNGQGLGCYVTLQSDGNLVIYDQSNKAIWASNTNGETGNYLLILQKDRNVVIYSLPIWATGTNTVGSAGVVIAGARNGTVGVTGAEQNKVREMGKIMEVEGDE